MTQGALRCARLGQLVGGARRRRRRRRAVAEAVARAHLNVAIARSQHRAGRAGAGPRPLQRRRVGLLHVVGRAAARDACRPAKYISTSAHERGAMLARVPGAKGPHSGWTGCTMRWPAGCRAACSLRDAFVPVSGPATLAHMCSHATPACRGMISAKQSKGTAKCRACTTGRAPAAQAPRARAPAPRQCAARPLPPPRRAPQRALGAPGHNCSVSKAP